MYHPFGHPDDPFNMIPSSRRRPGMLPMVFDEYYRCYPVAMMPGPDREVANHGGKVFLPPSALDKLTKMHISYPMQFELINGAVDKRTHAGVLEFVAEEGKIYLPFWLMQTLILEPGDLVQIKSTDLPQGSFIKLQAQSTAFLDISDPKAVLENVMQNYSCLTTGDVFTFHYNDQVYEMAVLETKPKSEKQAISVQETDLEVDFAAPVGYEEPTRTSGTSTPRNAASGLPTGGMLHPHGTMAQAINYSSIAPSSTLAAAGDKATSSNFLLAGQKLSSKKSSKAPTPNASTPVAGASTNEKAQHLRRVNGPQPLRLPPGKLFFGYEIKPLRTDAEKKEEISAEQPRFAGQGQTLRGGKRKGDADGTGKPKDTETGKKDAGPKLEGGGGRTLRDVK
ncbi:MAG: ubiquitin fusion degradation protein [Piccolia ochrophora]|nr:MAG: ubiquitin fusion degradation protein [Piccolia ochrophora]